MVDYPDNSGKNPEKREPIVQGLAKAEKESGLTKFADIFLPEDRGKVKEYIVIDVIVPYLRKIAEEAFHLFLYGRSGSSNQNASSQTSGLYYSGIFSNGSQKTTSMSSSNQKSKSKRIIFNSIADAQAVLTELRKELKRYGVVTVLTLCELANVPSSSIDDKHGWNDLSSATIERDPEGYYIKLPTPKAID